MAASNSKKVSYSSNPVRSENYMLLSATYPLNNSDTKRMHVGLRAINEDGTFEASIKLTGNSSPGIHFDGNSWKKFQEYMGLANDYLCGYIKEIPNPIFINEDVIINFTTAYGARSIMVGKRRKAPETSTAATATNDSEPPTKKRKTFEPSIIMQKTSFEGMQNIISCINVRYKELNSILNLVNDCTRFLIIEIELKLPKQSLDEDVIKQTLASNYEEIQNTVQRQLKDLEFLNCYFDIVFQELTTLHLYEIAKIIIINRTS